MATAPVKSPLHNFSLSFLKWGSTSSVNPHHRCRRPVDSSPPHPTDADSNRPASNLLTEKSHQAAPDSDPATAAAEDQVQRQWNLRPRRPAPLPAEIGGFGHAKSGELFAESETAPKSSRLRGMAMADAAAAEKREKQKLWVALSKEEIEEDIYALTGSKPSRRPRKRPRNVQKQIDTLLPGLWLVGMSPEAYRSLDAPTKK